jgi:hypothetical protein
MLQKIDTTSKSTIEASLAAIAQDLIINKAIKINERTFSFIDIEVYFWHKNHRDDFATGVKHCKAFGELEAHRYGIDISLGNQVNGGFGGMLIYGLFDNDNNEVIQKPSVHRTLFNSLRLSDNKIEFIEHRNRWDKTFRSKRNNLGKADKDKNKKIYAEYLYKFLAWDTQLFTSYKGKERMIENSNLCVKDKNKFLGYKKHRSACR